VVIKINRHRSQPTHVLNSKGVVLVNIPTRRRAKGGRSEEVNIELSLLSPYRHTARERIRSPHNRNAGSYARTRDSNINNQVLMRRPKIQSNDIPVAISGGIPDSANLQTQVPPLN
jgi:hypothetical protein